MRLEATADGWSLPFEGERSIVLRGLPAEAEITSASARLVPTDAALGFQEILRLADPATSWGGGIRRMTRAVEVDFHARRTLAAVRGAGLGGCSLLVDLGGGFVQVGATGALGGTPPYALVSSNAQALPGLTAVGLRIAVPPAILNAPDPDVSEVTIASPPADVVLLVGTVPIFSRPGDLSSPVSVPDFREVLAAVAPDLSVHNGCREIPFVIRSSSITRLKLEVRIDFDLAVAAMPAGVDRVSLDVGLSTVPASAPLEVTVPVGSRVVPGGTRGRIRGSFEATAVSAGPVGAAPVDGSVSVTPSSPHAQPVELQSPAATSSLDLHLAATSATANVRVDVVDDLDGRPGSTSVIGSPVTVELSRTTAGALTWVNVPLRTEVQLPAGRAWVVLQAFEGAVQWATGGAGGAPVLEGSPGLHLTTNRGMSWDATPSPNGQTSPRHAQLRLRRPTTDFAVPASLEVRRGDIAHVVPLARFAAQGTLDASLDFPELAQAFDAALAESPGCPSGEHLANGDFTQWVRVGDELQQTRIVGLGDSSDAQVVMVAADESTAYAAVLDAVDDAAMCRLYAIDALSMATVSVTDLGFGSPVAMAVDAASGLVAVAVRRLDQSIEVELASAAAGRAGPALPMDGELAALRFLATGRELALAWAPKGKPGAVAVVDTVRWRDGRADVALDELLLRQVSLAHRPVALAAPAGDDLHLLVLIPEASTGNAPQGAVVALGAELKPRAVLAEGIADPVALTDGGEGCLLLATTRSLRLMRDTGAERGSVELPSDTSVRAVAWDDQASRAFAVTNAGLVIADLAGAEVTNVDAADGFDLAIGGGAFVAVARGDLLVRRIGAAVPAHWFLTRGKVAPLVMDRPPEVTALLGTTPASLQSAPSATSGPHGGRGGGAENPDLLGGSGLSQVVPASGGCRYQLRLRGLAQGGPAKAEVLWRGDGCESLRVDAVDIEQFWNRDQAVAAMQGSKEPVLMPAELTVQAPQGATQAEVRLAVARDTIAAVTSVSFGATTNALAGAGAGAGVSAAAPAPIPVSGGEVFELAVRGRVSSPADGSASVRVAWLDAAGIAAAPPVEARVDTGFDVSGARGTIPAAARSALVETVVGAGVVAVMTDIRLATTGTATVGLGVVSEAPGNVTVTGVSVLVTDAVATRPSRPERGLCPPTEPGEQDCGPEGAHACAACGSTERLRDPVAARIGPTLMATGTCRACGAPVISSAASLPSGGQLQAGRELSLFHVTKRDLEAEADFVTATEVPLVAVRGIGEARAERLLEALGVDSAGQLARQVAGRVSDALGVSDEAGREIVADAKRIARDAWPPDLFQRRGSSPD